MVYSIFVIIIVLHSSDVFLFDTIGQFRQKALILSMSNEHLWMICIYVVVWSARHRFNLIIDFVYWWCHIIGCLKIYRLSDCSTIRINSWSSCFLISVFILCSYWYTLALYFQFLLVFFNFFLFFPLINY